MEKQGLIFIQCNQCQAKSIYKDEPELKCKNCGSTDIKIIKKPY